MPRPSQCIVCGTFEICLHPDDGFCADKLEREEIGKPRKQINTPLIPMPSKQQYSTPDGSIWAEYYDQVTGRLTFTRIAGKGHEDDYRAQKLEEVLRSYGSMSLHDPIANQVDVLTQALDRVTWFGCKTYIQENDGGPEGLIKAFDEMGYEIVRKDREDD